MRSILSSVPWFVWLLQCPYPTHAEASNLNSTEALGKEQMWPPAWTEQGCRNCTCDYLRRLVNCSNRDFSSGLPSASMFPLEETEAFCFSNSSVSFIDRDYFLNFSTLHIIQGQYNQLTRPFIVPSTITTLFLYCNRISSASGFFQRDSYHYNNLANVDLSHNCIDKITTGGFANFVGLRSLDLCCMKNPLPLVLEKGAIANLSLLTFLDLSDNGMTSASIHTLENVGNTGLKILLGGNDLVQLCEDFLMLPAVSHLDIHNCNIQHVHANAFRYLRNLRFLYMYDNKISFLPEGVFNHTETALSRLDLSMNNLTVNSTSGSLFRNGQQLFELLLANNRLVEIEESLFETITELMYLDVSSNMLRRLPRSLVHQHYLVAIILLGNRLTKIENSTFQGLRLLGYLNLMRNNIGIIESVAFNSLATATTLYLADNGLTSLPSDVFLPLRSGTIWLNCCNLKQLPQVTKHLTIQCETEGNAVRVLDLTITAARNLAYAGFVCKRNKAFDTEFDFSCTECPAGTSTALPSNSYPGTTKCKNCTAGGWYQDEAGQKDCKRCVNGTYVPPANVPGRSPLDCSVCPTGTNTKMHAGYRACPCLQGFYRLDRFGPCMACNATSPGLACKDDILTVKQGYWWSWSNGNSSDKQARFVNFMTQLKIRDDSYHRNFVNFSGSLPIVYRCPLPDSCHGGVTNEEMCKEGYAGPLCSLCELEYFSWFNTCQRCPPLWRGVLQLLLAVFLIVLLMFALFKADKLRMRQRQHTATVIDQLASKAKILIGFAQVMAGVLSALAYVPWPPLLLRVGSWLRSVELNAVEMANPSCFNHRLRINELEETVLNIVGQVLLLFSIFLYYRVRYCLLPSCCRRFLPGKNSLTLARRSCLRNSWWILFLCYPSTTAHILATLPYKDWTCMELCRYDNQQDCPWYLKADPSIQCSYNDDSDNHVLFIVCWAMTVYVVCLPLLLLWGLFKRHRSPTLPQPHPSDDDNFVSLRNRRSATTTDLLISLEFLDENYETKFWYWELLEMVRKLLLTCGIEYFGSSSLSGVAIASLIANVFLMLHAQFKPIKRNSEHWLQLLSLLVISLSVMLGTLIALEQATDNSLTSDDAYDRLVFSVIVLFVNGLFALYLLGRVGLAVLRSVNKVRFSGGRYRIALFLIYLFSDDNSSDCISSSNALSIQQEDELSNVADHITSSSE